MSNRSKYPFVVYFHKITTMYDLYLLEDEAFTTISSPQYSTVMQYFKV